MSDVFLPVLANFEEDNLWTASGGRFRYKVTPDVENKLLRCEGWEGPWAYEFSAIEIVDDFPMTEEGLDALREWIDRWTAEVNARPTHTLAEDIARRDAVLAAQKEAES